MAHTLEIIKVLKQVAEINYNDFIHTLHILFNNASTKFIDDIPTIVVTKEEKKTYDAICTIIDVPYPNEKEFISIYILGSGFIKLAVKSE